jgi:elongation factor P
MKIIANLIKIGNVLEHKGKKFHVLNTNTIKPGKGGAYIQVEIMKDLEHQKILKSYLLMKF